MGILGFAKKLVRRTYTEWGAEDGLANFPAAGHGVYVPTYLAVEPPEPVAAVIQLSKEQWKEAVNG